METGNLFGNHCDISQRTIGLETENKRNRSKLNHKETGFNTFLIEIFESD
jgi:flagellar basal body-associated protein FliL